MTENPDITMAARTKLNVQSFPRPPLLEKIGRHIKILWDGQLIADTEEAYWVLETHHPPSSLPRARPFHTVELSRLQN
jgi:uncharacterized protein (DUF427 family)